MVMNRAFVFSSVGAAAALAMFTAPSAANAACGDRKAVGTIVGGVGGALLGNSIRKGGTGAVIGGLGGAVLGHEVARRGGGCTTYRSSSYNSGRSYSRTPVRTRTRYITREAPPQPVRYVYYDQYGQPISSGPAPGYASNAGYSTTMAPTMAAYRPTTTGYGSVGACRTEYRSFYDERGTLVQRPMQVCDR
jgi:hypothetical protein